MTAHAIATTLDPIDPLIRSEAGRLAERLDGGSQVGRVVRSMLQDVAEGTKIVVLRAEDEVTPAQAARMLGVTRQFVDRLCEDQVLTFRRLPGSSHRRIRVQDVLDVQAERQRLQAGAATLRTAIADAGLN